MKRWEASGITVFQVFFLSFAYVFSGLFLIREEAFLSLLLPLAAALVYCALGYSFLQCAPCTLFPRERWLSFLSCGKPHAFARAFAVLLTLLGAAELVLSWIALAFSVGAFSDFISFSLAAALTLLLALFAGAHGPTVLGRFSELFAFPIAVLLLNLVFFDFAPVDFGAFSDDLYALFTVTPAPILYLFSLARLPSTAMPHTAGATVSVPVGSFLGTLAAVLCTFLFLLCKADGGVFHLLFGWMASLIRLSLLICVCTAHRAPLLTHVKIK